MENQRKKTIFILSSLGLLYFVLFIFPNRMGAADVNMLGLFEVDEYAFYPHVIRMLTPGDTAYQTLRNFLIYLQYFYGYPFFFFSALTLLPVKWLAGGGWEMLTRLNVTLLRQMLSVLPMLLSSFLLVSMQTGFKSRWRSLALFLLLLSLPGAVGNNIFWHPDGLSLLTIVLTFFFLDRDDLSFGVNFILAAAFCGMAAGVKSQGFFFFLAIPLYIFWGVFQHRINWRKASLMALAFVAVMVLALVVTNPLLLLPIERGEIIATQSRNLAQLAQGFMVRTSEPYFQWGMYPEDFRIHYGEWFFMLLLLAGALAGIRQPQKRLLNLLILAFVVPMMVSMNFSGTRRTHYFLPIVLPLMSGLVHLFPKGGLLANLFNRGQDSVQKQESVVRPIQLYGSKFVTLLFGALVLVQAGLFLRTDVRIINEQLNREADSQSIAFYHQLDEIYFSKLPSQQKMIIYRDWRAYVPDGMPGWRVEINWDLADYDYIAELQPDVILLEMENVKLFTQEGVVEQASDPEHMQAWQDFYGDALNDELPGYRIILQDHFGLALVRE